LNARIFIVLATYNGAEFLSEQIDSLDMQSIKDWKLLIRDDGSTDQSPEIIRQYSDRDKRIVVLPSAGTEHSSALSNFSSLLSGAHTQGADYVFCCDQDDVWKPDKIEKVLAHLQALEGPDRAPCLVHHDLMVVDDCLRPVAASFVELMQLRPSNEVNPQRLISRNEVTGCAMACNRALLEIALPISDKAVMHDWWLALCAGFFGRLEFIPEQLVHYRQHGDNAIGAKSFWHGLNPCTNWVAGWRRGNEEFIRTVEQAHAFREAMGVRLDRGSRACEILELYGRLDAAGRIERLRVLRQCGLWRTHWFLNLMLVLRMLLLPRVTAK
jgi:glycosyltransferase involved in cell wall biosynthesis